MNRSRACWGLARIPTAAARRTSTGRVSPRTPRPVARPPMVALNRNASGASARMKIFRVPCSPGWWSLTHTPNDPCACASASAAASGSHASQHAVMIASMRPHDSEWAYLAIRRSTTATVASLRWRVVSAVLRPIHGLTSPAQIRAHSCGSRWRRSNASATSRSAAVGGGGEDDAELGRRELRHARCAGATEPDQLLTAGQQSGRWTGRARCAGRPSARRPAGWQPRRWSRAVSAVST